MRQILRYSTEIQKALGCKTKPEPWLHIGIWYANELPRTTRASYAIWIWDTREIVEYKFGALDNSKAKLVNGRPAKDSKDSLKGQMSAVFVMPNAKAANAKLREELQPFLRQYKFDNDEVSANAINAEFTRGVISFRSRSSNQLYQLVRNNGIAGEVTGMWTLFYKGQYRSPVISKKYNMPIENDGYKTAVDLLNDIAKLVEEQGKK